MAYKRTLDRLTGHDYPGVYSHSFVQWELDELELGCRVACDINDPEQTWWELIGTPMVVQMERDEKTRNPGNSNDDSLDSFPPEYM